MGQRSQAESEFLAWLDEVAPAPIGKFVLPERDLPQEKAAKVERYRHKWLMENSFWYRQAVGEAKRREEAIESAKLKGQEYEEPRQMTLNEDGFWEQF